VIIKINQRKNTLFWSLLHKASVFYFIVCTLSTNISTSRAQNKNWCVPFHCKLSWFTWTFLIPHTKAKMKSNGDKASPCFKTFLVGKMSDKMLAVFLYIL